ncbi:NAD-dependent epimerase/dehydratase family protein [Bosea sp. BIWAKO-01]|uniref:NAD-dependent epimerase/dehydratase family protein n=1 Tax=Bosea sp. BIWAKO-01 TaxID=506668 RepID=UPI000853156D|nr:GDP-mannose 4,6-dehydratase [Bosea sp. BIWAKO-01]GAU82916.1 GDP-mannose 4,6-dehydratase [Bosea sp. BIWAKO-01]
MRILMTGASGFVAAYAAQALRDRMRDVVLVAATREGEPLRGFDETIAFDVADGGAARVAIEMVQPTHVLHLAGIAAPPAANAQPELAWQVNTLGTLALGRAILATKPDTILLNGGSGVAYGDSANRVERIDEETAFAPGDDYGATKAAADLGLAVLAKRGLKVIRLRPFNHTGPGQSQDYAIPAFAAQIAAIERREREAVVKVGNLEAERDIADVGDVADGYALVALAASNGRLQWGRAYNLCTGRGVRIRSVLELLLSMSSARIAVQQDPSRMRPSDLPRMVGDPMRAETELGWRASTPLESTLARTLDHWRERATSA